MKSYVSQMESFRFKADNADEESEESLRVNVNILAFYFVI